MVKNFNVPHREKSKEMSTGSGAVRRINPNLAAFRKSGGEKRKKKKTRKRESKQSTAGVTRIPENRRQLSGA